MTVDTDFDNQNKIITGSRIIEVGKTGVGILMVEQNAKQALSIANRGYVLVNGENRIEGTGSDLLNNADVRKSFLGG